MADLVLRRNRTHGFEERELGAIQRRCRDALATLIGAQATEIALVPNTSFGVSLAAALVAAGPAGDVLVPQGEFPANVLPWKSLEPKGFRVRTVPSGPDRLPDEAALLSAINAPGVRAVAVSTVQFASGYRADLSRIGAACRERGVLLCVDAIQSLGVDPFDVAASGAHVVAAGGQKWLCGPWGSGFVWIDPEVRDHFASPIVSWLAVQGGARLEGPMGTELDWRDDARKFEPATLGVQDYLGLACSVEVLLEIGIEEIRHHVHRVHEPLLDWIESRSDVELWTPSSPDRRAGIVALRPDRLADVQRALEDANVVFSVREGAIRFAPHFYSSVSEMALVVERMEKVLTTRM